MTKRKARRPLTFLRMSLLLLLTPSFALTNVPQQLADGRTIVLTYHDMVPRRDRAALWFDCTPGELIAQLDYMKKKGANFIRLDQLYDHLTKGAKLPRRPVAITFADSYQGFFDLAYPILRQRQIPVAMFVHTGFVGDRSHGRPKMDWDELLRLDREGLVTIGSQTVTHPPDLRQLSIESQRWEFKESKRTLEQRLGHPIHLLAYPNGKFNLSSERLAQASGYLMAFSEVTRPAELSPNLFAVNRYVHTRYLQAIRELTNAGRRTGVNP